MDAMDTCQVNTDLVLPNVGPGRGMGGGGLGMGKCIGRGGLAHILNRAAPGSRRRS